MPYLKTWIGTTGDYELSTNWQLIGLRNARHAWTASGSGTNEYYVRTAAGADPGFVATPPTTTGVYINSAAATKGTLGSLTAGQWGYGDNDALGYSTVYVRLSGGGDPDAQDADHVQFRQIPQAGEDVRIPAGSGSISSNLDQSAVAIDDFIVEEGYDGTIGAATGYLLIDPNKFEFNSREQAYIDVHTAAITCIVHDAGGADDGEYGLNLRGSAIVLLDVRGGSVGVAPNALETAAVTTLRITGERTIVMCGPGVTLTTAGMFHGNLWLRCNVTTLTMYAGIVYLQETAAATTVNNLGGNFHWGSSGNITTYNARGGVLNMRASMAARTLGTLNRYINAGQIIHNKESVTITTDTKQDSFTETITA
jgi:hypothetical protein